MGNCWCAGPSIFAGYWQKPEANAECFDAEGWFRTGDIAHLDADGFLYITDRKKELLKTSGGKLVAPQPIENKLKNNVLVAQAALVGDKHKFISALLSPNFAALEAWAQQHGIEAKSRAELVADSRVHCSLWRDCARGEQRAWPTLKRSSDSAWWPMSGRTKSGELTPSMKLKRRVITARYAAVIAALYADEATARRRIGAGHACRLELGALGPHQLRIRGRTARPMRPRPAGCRKKMTASMLRRPSRDQ